MFNCLPTYSKSNHLVLQENISRGFAIRNKNIIFYFYCLHVECPYMETGCCRVASKIVLSNIERCDGCVLWHCMIMKNSRPVVLKFLIGQLVTLNKTKIVCSVTASKPFVACGVRISPVIGYNTNIPDIFQCSHYYKRSCKFNSKLNKNCCSSNIFCNEKITFLIIYCSDFSRKKPLRFTG